MRLVYNSNSTMHLPALMQIRVARETGWDGIFLREEHLRRYLAQGYDGGRACATALARPGPGQSRGAARRRTLATCRAGGHAPPRPRR